MKAVVVGGGIAGLACAVSLHKQDWDVEVLERAAEFGEIGAGLSLWSNALRALDELGLGDRVREQSAMEGSAGIRDKRGRWLSRTDVSELERRYGPVAMIHRATLLDTLLGALPASSLHAGVTVESVDEQGLVRHSGGESRADLVVGADGLNSVVRKSLWPNAKPPRYAGYTAWRMVTRQPVDVGFGAEAWGRGERFGYVVMSDGRTYCFAVANAPEGAGGGGIDELRRRFGDWHEPVPSLLAAVEDEDLLHHDLYDLPSLSSYVSGQVALAGDAAHAMTPNLGQGACQALEDAVVLGRCAAADDLASYDAQRRPRATMISKRSAMIGRMAQWESPVAVALRDTLLRATPQSSFLRSLKPVLTWPEA
jgi:2-polyprenyl-6-methoxyphenol hydroxylase-like FAD-dependent oxidoreductase